MVKSFFSYLLMLSVQELNSDPSSLLSNCLSLLEYLASAKHSNACDNKTTMACSITKINLLRSMCGIAELVEERPGDEGGTVEEDVGATDGVLLGAGDGDLSLRVTVLMQMLVKDIKVP